MTATAPASSPSMYGTATSRRRRWGWIGGLALMVVAWQALTDGNFFHLTFHGYDYGEVMSALPILVLVGLLAPLVSYRRRDALFLLVPVWNLVVLWTIGSRLARLPDRDWPQRRDETTAIVSHGDQPRE